MKKIVFGVVAVLSMTLFATSCSDFLDRAPEDSLSPSTFWKTESDADLALAGVYNGLYDIYGGYYNNFVYWDCTSDNYFSNFSWEGYKTLTTGTSTAASPGISFFNFLDIRTCNEYLANESNVEWSSEEAQNEHKAEVRAVRAFLYFWKSELYGDFPLITEVLQDPVSAMVARDPVDKVREFFVSELKDCIQYLPDKSDGVEGRFNKQFVQGLLMRYYLFRGDYANALSYAEEIRKSGQFSLPSTSYADSFLLANQQDSETILSYSFIANTDRYLYEPMYLANGINGWSSLVPTLDLMDAFECIDGLTIDESPLYDPEEPFLNRDPRLRASIVYPGQPYPGYATCYNSMPQKLANGDTNPDYYKTADNSSKTGLQLGKYFQAANVDPSSTNRCTMHFKVMRYAEVLLTIAECEIELNKNLDDAVECLNMIRSRAGMPAVDQTRYNSQETLRELVRRERRVELNGEGLRRFDLIRWGTIVDVLKNFQVEHLDGDVLPEKDANGDYKVKVTGRSVSFSRDEYKNFDENKILLPIDQVYIDIDPNLKQNNGY